MVTLDVKLALVSVLLIALIVLVIYLAMEAMKESFLAIPLSDWAASVCSSVR